MRSTRNQRDPDTAIGEPVNPSRLYEDHFVFVWSCLRRLGVSAPELEDAAHDVFVAAHRHRGEFPEANPRSWLFGAVRRIAANHRRGAWRHRRRITAARDVLPTTTSVDRDVDHADATQIVGRFLDGLAPRDREVFVLFELQELTAREVAEILGININTASARLRVARSAFERFAERVRAENPFDPGVAVARCRTHDRPEPATQARVGAGLALVLKNSGTMGGLTAWMNAAALGTVIAATTAVAASIAVSPTTAHAPVEGTTIGASTTTTTTTAPVEQPPIARTPVALLPIVDAPPVALASAQPPSRRTILEQPTAREPAGIDDGIAVHNDWLARARDALASGDHHEAARLGAAYRERFPDGAFVAELGLLEVRARCADGDDAGAKRVGAQLVRSVGGAAYGVLLERTCAAQHDGPNARGRASGPTKPTRTTSGGN